jgi:HlyD family secretion protein
VLVLLAACGGVNSAPRADVPREATVHRGDLTDRILLTGELRPSTTSAVEIGSPKTDREVNIRWAIEDGATVKAGDRVIELDNSAFTEGLEQKRIAANESALAANDAAALAAIALADKEAELKQAEIALARAKLLAGVPTDLLSAHDAQQRQLDLQRAQTAYDTAKRSLKAQKDGDALELHVKQLDRDKTKRQVDDAESSIDALVIKAPRDGTLVLADSWQGRKIQVGDTVWPGMSIATMPDLTQALDVQANLSDVDDGRITAGMTGTCTLDAYPSDPIPCSVRDLSPVARDQGHQSLRRAFGVTLSLGKNDPAHQRPGMSVKVELRGAPVKNVLLVPRGAVAGNKVRTPAGEREVKLGACDPQACIVESGLADGDKVLL